MEQNEPSIDILMETWNDYQAARVHLLSHLHRPKSLRDPVGEWSEMLVKQLLHGSFPVKPDLSIDPVRKGYDLVLDKDGTQVQIKSLSNPKEKWVNPPDPIQFTNNIGAYAIVFFTDLRPEVVLVFPKQLKPIRERLGKQPSKQDTELLLTQRNFEQILKDKRAFTSLGIRIWCYDKSERRWKAPGESTE